MMIATHWGTGQSDGAVIEQLLTMNEVLRSEKEELIEQLDSAENEIAEQAKQLGMIRGA